MCFDEMGECKIIDLHAGIPMKRNTIQLYSKQQSYRKTSLKHPFTFRPYIGK